MGNKGSRSARASEADGEGVCETPKVELPSDEPAGGGLCRDDAWEIALAWREQLRGCVRLEIDAERRGLGIVESFEWVTLVFNGSLAGGFTDVDDAYDAAAAARAATIAWSALSCCAGYSGKENPQFWRRVFTELYYPEYPSYGTVLLKARPDRPQRPITASTPFFPDDTKPFPRVRIVAKPGQEAGCLMRLVTTPLEGHADAHHTEKLDQLLARIKPFILESRWRKRSVPVAVDDESAIGLLSTVKRSWRPRGAEEDITSTNERHLPRLTSIFLSATQLPHIQHTHHLLASLDANIVVPSCDSSHLIRRSDGRGRLDLVDSAYPSHRVRISMLDILHASDPEPSPFPQVFSALPRSQSFTRIRLFHDTRQIEKLRASDWAWLGYAVFHPDAAEASSFTVLELDITGAPPDKLKVFTSMAKGNNMPAEAGVTVATANSTYEFAKVRAGTVAFSDPRNVADVLWSFESETTIGLCVTGVAKYASLGEWVRVVIPGVGLGWIRSRGIVELTSRPAGPSCLKGLAVNVHSRSGYSSLLTLLAVVGERLRLLDIDCSTLMGTEEVLSVLRLCPSLTSLRIGHDGECWADANAIAQLPRYPRLHQLELRLGKPGSNGLVALKALKAAELDDLTSFQVVTHTKGDFSTNRGSFLRVLARYRGIQYAHHTDGVEATASWDFKSYDDRRAEMLAILGRIQRGVHDVYQGPMRLDCRLAFLSVINHLATTASQPPQSALHRFGADIVRRIFSFATSPVQRDFYVDQCPRRPHWY